MNTLTRMALIAAFAAAPLAACTEPEVENAADRTEETVENAADATGDAARDVAAETRETVDETTTTTEETTVRAGDEGLEVRNTETY